MTVWLEGTCGHELRWDSEDAPPESVVCVEHGRVALWAQRLEPSPEGLPGMVVASSASSPGETE